MHRLLAWSAFKQNEHLELYTLVFMREHMTKDVFTQHRVVRSSYLFLHGHAKVTINC
jgi:hypothetical protein